MKKLAIIVFVLSIACNQAPKTEAVVSTEPAANPTEGKLLTEGPEIDLMKKLVSSYEKGDWVALRSCFSDSAVVFVNAWAPDTTLKGIPIADAIAADQKERTKMYDSVKTGSPIYEVVVTPDGKKYGHCWINMVQHNMETANWDSFPVFFSWEIRDNKLAWEWVFYNPTPVK